MRKTDVTNILKNSVMRLSLVWGMSLASLLFVALAYRIAFKDTVDYTGIAFLIASLTTFIGALVTGKYFQKKEELKNE